MKRVTAIGAVSTVPVQLGSASGDEFDTLDHGNDSKSSSAGTSYNYVTALISKDLGGVGASEIPIGGDKRFLLTSWFEEGPTRQVKDPSVINVQYQADPDFNSDIETQNPVPRSSSPTLTPTIDIGVGLGPLAGINFLSIDMNPIDYTVEHNKDGHLERMFWSLKPGSAAESPDGAWGVAFDLECDSSIDPGTSFQLECETSAEWTWTTVLSGGRNYENTDSVSLSKEITAVEP